VTPGDAGGRDVAIRVPGAGLTGQVVAKDFLESGADAAVTLLDSDDGRSAEAAILFVSEPGEAGLGARGVVVDEVHTP
jgi:hypothetical protein